MKQFNLEEYLKNPERKIVTKNGKKVRVLCTDRKGATPIIALVNSGLPDCKELCYSFFPDGKKYENYESDIDLFFASEKHEGWINIFRGKDNPFTGNIIFASKEEAEESGRHCCGFTKDLYMTSVKIEWED